MSKMFRSAVSSTYDMTFAQVTERLAHNERVEGLIVIGSASRDKLTPASDFDLVIVLTALPLPLHVGVTSIDHRLTDLIFLTRAQIEEILATTSPIEPDAWLGRIVRWLQDGAIIFDRHTRLTQAQRKVRQGQWLTARDKTNGYGTWFRVNYNLAQSRRLLASSDPVYLITADIRAALYGPTDLLFSYFSIRNLVWEGDKAAVRYLIANDPAYLDLFREFIAETDRIRKFQLYEDLAVLTIAPVGELWESNDTATTFEGDVGLDIIEKAADFWDTLIEGD
jgi:predicted nucleotidyltransferase